MQGREANSWRGWRGGRVWMIALAYLALTGWLSFELNTWRDEMYSLHTSSGSPVFAIQQAVHFELQPPFYFLALSLWRVFSHSVFFARLFSSLCGCGAIVATAALGARL